MHRTSQQFLGAVLVTTGSLTLAALGWAAWSRHRRLQSRTRVRAVLLDKSESKIKSKTKATVASRRSRPQLSVAIPGEEDTGWAGAASRRVPEAELATPAAALDAGSLSAPVLPSSISVVAAVADAPPLAAGLTLLPPPLTPLGAGSDEVFLEGAIVRREAYTAARDVLAHVLAAVVRDAPALDAHGALGLELDPTQAVTPEALTVPGTVAMHGEYVFNYTDPDRRARIAAGLGAAMGPERESGIPQLGGAKLLSMMHRPPVAGIDSCVYHLGVLKQMDDGPCGYHALYNALVGIALCQVRLNDVGARNHALALFNARTPFWWFYAHLEAALVVEARSRLARYGSEAFPWRECDVRSGVLERAHVAWLLAHHPLFVRAGAHLFSVLPASNPQEIANGSMSLDELDTLDAVLEHFAGLPHYAHAFVLGAHSHWITVVAHKRHGSIECLFLDSNNVDLFGYADPQLAAFLQQPTSYMFAESGATPRAVETEDEEYGLMLRAARGTAELMIDWITGRTALKTFVADTVVRLMLSKFEHRVLRRSPYGGALSLEGALGHEQFLAWLVEWLTHWDPPATLRAGPLATLRQLGAAYLSPELRNRVLEWALLVGSSPVVASSPHPAVGELRLVLHEVVALTGAP
ncbi:uncharacterized protein AMSG_02549 [Thecamonas trahens ATCC 50062]|uniref:Uncharacterized protein n=1 Tax=Thecamonas trahens ATCC 50062 TaxID=461836 RepID=A0A0L0D575_THETB|nr:hypothetical protein AMSG_02549 [Thecamonas trahens ATCC 50062]KNC47527.1 hypothetical protein AMSG_02549 [Thecamonas trahens ATCC 50062]|eukprot:XP_013759461.1 hypothetical protein AMSG_02549 [Thecamonas trahens ATCC 50062]